MLMRKSVKKAIRRGGALTLAGVMLLSAGISGKTAQAKSESVNVGGAIIEASVSDGRSSGKTTAKIVVKSGPTISLSAEARIYYRFDKKAYYATSGKSTSTAISLSKTVEKYRAGAEVDQCKGMFSAYYNNTSWSKPVPVGELKSGYTYTKDTK